MILSDIEARLPALYLASCEDGGAVPYFTSPPGRGKTSVVKLFPNRMKQVDPKGNYGLVILNGATLNIGTMGGYLQFGPLFNGKPTSLFSLPHWWWTKEKKALEEHDGGIILIDEADKMPPDERKTTGEAALEKLWMSHYLPPGWVVWFAGNRMVDRSGSGKDFDHLINRRREIAVRDDTESWAEWARKAHLLPEVITFGEENPQLLFEEKPDKQGPWCTPRSLHQAEIHLKALIEIFQADTIPTDPLCEEEIAGGVGSRAAAQLIKTIRMGQELPTYEAVVANPGGTMIPSKPDGKRLMAYRMADRIKEPDAKKVLTYMGRFEQEFQTIFVRLAINKNYNLVFETNFGDWCAKNAALIAILERYKQKA